MFKVPPTHSSYGDGVLSLKSCPKDLKKGEQTCDPWLSITACKLLLYMLLLKYYSNMVYVARADIYFLLKIEYNVSPGRGGITFQFIQFMSFLTLLLLLSYTGF